MAQDKWDQYAVQPNQPKDKWDQYAAPQSQPVPAPRDADGKVYDQPDTGEYQPLGTKEKFSDQMNDAAAGSMIAAPFVDATMPEVGVIPEAGQVAGAIRNVGKLIMHPRDTMGDIVESVASRFAKPKAEPVEPDYAANQAVNRNLQTSTLHRGASAAPSGPAGPTAPVGKPTPGIPQPEPELGSPERPGWNVKLPSRMPKPAAEPEPETNPMGLTQEENLARNQRLNKAQLTKNHPSMDKGGPATGTSQSVGKSISGQRGASVPSGRSISAGDLASWSKEDLWSEYMKEKVGLNKDLAQRIADELARRGEVKAVGRQIK